MLIKFDKNFKNIKGSPNGIDIYEFKGGCVYNVPSNLATSFIADGKAWEDIQLIENFTEIPSLEKGVSLSESLVNDFQKKLNEFTLDSKEEIKNITDKIIQEFKNESKETLKEFKQKAVKIIPNTNNLIWVDHPLSVFQKLRNKIAMVFYNISKIIEVKYG